jgi:hypothetical protein
VELLVKQDAIDLGPGEAAEAIAVGSDHDSPLAAFRRLHVERVQREVRKRYFEIYDLLKA